MQLGSGDGGGRKESMGSVEESKENSGINERITPIKASRKERARSISGGSPLQSGPLDEREQRTKEVTQIIDELTDLSFLLSI